MFYSRPRRLLYEMRQSYYMTDYKYKRLRWQHFALAAAIYGFVPQVGIRTMHWLDKLPYWENRIE